MWKKWLNLLGLGPLVVLSLSCQPPQVNLSTWEQKGLEPPDGYKYTQVIFECPKRVWLSGAEINHPNWTAEGLGAWVCLIPFDDDDPVFFQVSTKEAEFRRATIPFSALTIHNHSN